MRNRLSSIVNVVLVLTICSPLCARAAGDVVHARLANGLQVIVVRNSIAPVVTTMLNYKVGSDDESIDGLAHATEHMMFRGSDSLSAAQLIDTLSVTGGTFNADTENAVTKYYFTVPSQYLDIALRAERSRATGLLMAPSEWEKERGAISEEVEHYDGNAIYRLLSKMRTRILAGTPYAKNGLGTVSDFKNKVDSSTLLHFYHAWYHPNNAVYIIVGDVAPETVIKKVRSLFGDIPPAKLPLREQVQLHPLVSTSYRDISDQPFTGVLLGYRMPGYDSNDYAAAKILVDVLSNQRSAFGSLPFAGKALFARFVEQSFAKASVGIAFVGIPTTAKPEDCDQEIRAILRRYARDGVPADLVMAAQMQEESELEFDATSIQGLASEWSDAVVVQGLSSPTQMLQRIQNVTPGDVTRVLRTDLDGAAAVSAYAIPQNAGITKGVTAVPSAEDNIVAPSVHEPLPLWAQNALDHLQVPSDAITPVDMTLSNGIRLIVQPEHASHAVVVTGQIRNSPGIQEPAGKEGIGEVTAALLPYGTARYDRLTLQEQLDRIAAKATPGTRFSLKVLSSSLDRGVELLAEEETRPALSPAMFDIVRQRAIDAVGGAEKSPNRLAEIALNDALYPVGDPSRRVPTLSSVTELTAEDAKDWYEKAYRPDLTTIVVVGDTTAEQAKAIFEKYFGGWQRSGKMPVVDPPPVPPNAPRQLAIPATGRVQSSVKLAETIALLRSDPQWPTLELVDTILAGGFFSGLLYSDLREAHGYVYFVDSDIVGERNRSLFTIRYDCDPSKVALAQSRIIAILKGIDKAGVDANQLLRSKALLMGDFSIRESSYDGIAQQLLDYAIHDLPLNQNSIDAQIQFHASATSVQDVVSKYLRPDDFVMVTTGP